MRPFSAGRRGVEVTLRDVEQDLLAGLVTDLRHLLMSEHHETLRRLQPPAHPGDDDAEAGYRAMVDDELLRGRLDALDVVDETLGGAVLDDGQVAAWMQALNNLRLILGERLALDGADLQDRDLPDSQAGAVYEWTGYLLEVLVAASWDTLPPATDD